jgi:hypothetical protein
VAAVKEHWTDRLQRFDRRWIFLVMGLAIVVPLWFPLGLPVKPSPMTRAAFDTVEELKPGDVVFVSVDLDPAATPELEPYFKAVMLQLKRKNVKMVLVTLWYKAPPLVERWIREYIETPIAPEGTAGYSGPPDRAYRKNVDYAYLGFREGKQITISALGNDVRKTFDGKTNDGMAIDQISWLNGIKQLKDFRLMVLVSAGFPGAKEYVQFVQARYNLRMVAACTAVSTTDLSPYFQTSQLLGLVGGMTASAEYEVLVGKSGTALQATDVISVGHILIILAIVFGNVIYFLGRARSKRRAS